MPTFTTRLGCAPRLQVAPSRVGSAPLLWNGKPAARPRATPSPLFVLLCRRLTFAVLLILAAVATPSLSVQTLSLTSLGCQPAPVNRCGQRLCTHPPSLATAGVWPCASGSPSGPQPPSLDHPGSLSSTPAAFVSPFTVSAHITRPPPSSQCFQPASPPSFVPFVVTTPPPLFPPGRARSTLVVPTARLILALPPFNMLLYRPAIPLDQPPPLMPLSMAMLPQLRFLSINVNGINETRKMDELKSWLARLPAPADLVILIDTRLIHRIPNLDLKLRPHSSAHAPALLSTESATGRPMLIGGVSILSINRAISLSSPDHLYAPLCSLSFINPTVAPRPWRLRRHLLMRPHVSQIIDFCLAIFPSTPSPDSWDSWKLDLTLNLKRFSNQERRCIDGTVAHLEYTIGSLQRHAAYTPLTQAESNRLDQARLHLARYEASKAFEIALKAKLKVEGLREMGVSSLLSGLNSRIKGSIISSLTLPNGQTTSDLPTMTNLCSNFFQTLYNGKYPATANTAFWQHIPPSSIPNPLILRLGAPFSLAEIGKALLSLSRGKTPGPDGLPGELFQQFALRFAPVFHSLLSPPQPLSRLSPPMLTGRSVLIPKRGDSSLVENLRPITFINADYKVLALCLANHLQLVLPQLIHPSQTAFIKHRKIGDTINDTLDIMDWATFSSTPLLALTVDFRKAYDLVNRPFLLQALTVLGIPTLFIHWVRLMHSDMNTRISVNNTLSPTFPVRTGVRQGCSLAPLLFVCVIEIFHRYMSLFLPGFALSPFQRRLMACYTDDVTLFLTSHTELGLAVILLGVFDSVSGEILLALGKPVPTTIDVHRIERLPRQLAVVREDKE
ncbi:unnamed protein product [Closterium sp. NIES-64]|nr:unnamed protein product [Closterium sp. NIES-64]